MRELLDWQGGLGRTVEYPVNTQMDSSDLHLSA